MIRIISMLVLVALAACTPAPTPEVSRAAANIGAETLPRMRRFDGTQPRLVPAPANHQLAMDIIELTMELESGKPLPVFSRFEGPITVTISPGAPASLSYDLDQLLIRLRREAGLNISRVPPGAGASITIEALPQSEFRRLSSSACFVVPNVSSWVGYLGTRGEDRLRWENLRTRKRAAVFLPEHVSPQEMRDCLHEEIAQALGPLNDLYRLPWSVFNDDNLHSVLTSYDMSVLRAIYHPRLQSGMSRDELARRLPAVLSQTNPSGNFRNREPLQIRHSAQMDVQIERLQSTPMQSRSYDAAAQGAVNKLRAKGINDVRTGHIMFLRGQALLRTDPYRAAEIMVEAADVFRASYGDEVHAAHAMVHPIHYAIGSGEYDLALRLIARALPAAKRGQNAQLLASLLTLKAEALQGQGAWAQADGILKQAYAWARYGYGDGEVLATRRVTEVAALRPGI